MPSVLSSMQAYYGPEEGKKIFYASANKGTITGVHGKSKKRKKKKGSRSCINLL
jgi:hypothetical protein